MDIAASVERIDSFYSFTACLWGLWDLLCIAFVVVENYKQLTSAVFIGFAQDTHMKATRNYFPFTHVYLLICPLWPK